MCGIAGILDVARSAEFDRVTLARELLLQIQKRGRHATGYAFVDHHETVIEKADMPADEFVQLAPLFVGEELDAKPRVILLHARYATQGSPKVNFNNHPIYSKRTGMTLIHNGWLTNEREILEKYQLQKDGDVDSETILRLIEHFLSSGTRSINRAIKLAMRELKGRFACALISERYPNTLWLWRDNKPLHVVRDPKSGAFIFASTEDLLRGALDAAGIVGGKISEFPHATIARLMVVKGKIRAAFEKLRKRPTGKKKASAKKQTPIKNDHPLIGMPSREGWEQWKAQGRSIEEQLKKSIEGAKSLKFIDERTGKTTTKVELSNRVEIDEVDRRGKKTTTVIRRRKGQPDLRQQLGLDLTKLLNDKVAKKQFDA